MKDHTPIKINEFNGLWARGDHESVPMDHFSDCDNIKFFESGFGTRDGIEQFPVGDDCGNLSNTRRIYSYLRADNIGRRLLVLDDDFNIYDTGSPTPCTPILTVDGMTDFAMVAIAGRAYISPHDGVTGLEDEFLYVYLGDGAVAVKAAGIAPDAGPMTAAAGAAGHVEAGYHVFGVVFEYETGFTSAIGIPSLVAFNASGTTKVNLGAVDTGPSNVVKRHIVATKAIDPALFTGDLEGYEFFFVPNGTIANNSGTTITVDFYDADLLDSASDYFDFFTEIPAGVFLTTYHGRLVIGGFYGEDNTDPQLDESGLRGTAYLSLPGEPEAINQVDGVIIPQLDGNALTNAQEYRDILYIFKNARTYSYSDNGDAPSSWQGTVLDQGYGCTVHGIATVLDSGGINTDFLIIANYNGICLFNGGFVKPELSYKIDDYWKALDREAFLEIQILCDTISKKIFSSLPNKILLHGDFNNGLGPKDIKWAPWSFNMQVTTIALVDTNTLIIGSLAEMP